MLILASKSPRRQELLKNITSNFVIEVSDLDESQVHADPYHLPEVLSKFKAQKVFEHHPNDTILAADTIVIIDGKVLGKPHDKKEATAMLQELSNKTHDVITGFTILKKDFELTKSVLTKVHFNKLSETQIKEYVDTLSPLDKAGAYGIQDEEYHLIKKIEGSYSNVMGLPLEELKKYL